MADLMESVNVLAEQIGPRPVSTEEENQASLYIAQELTEKGLDVSVDEFATPTGIRWTYALAYALAALGTAISGIGVFVPGISLSMFVVGLVFDLAGLFIFYTEWNSKPFLSKMRVGGVSQNVVAKYIPSSVARETRRRKVIICAHVDTVRVRPEDGPRFIGYAPLLRKIVFYCMIGLPVVLFIRLLPLPWPEVIDTILWVISLIASLYVLVAAACIVVSHFTPFISGGNDNASSIAVLLSVARLLLNPEERERYAMEHPIAQDVDVPVETFATDATGPIPLIDDLEEPVMHSEEEAYEAGLVPEGVEIMYDDDVHREDATVAFSSLSPEEQLGVLADTAAEELHLESVDTGAFSLDDIESADEGTASLRAIPEIKVPDLEFTLDEQDDIVEEEPVKRVDDAVIFAEYMAAESEEEAACEAEAEDARVIEVEAIAAEEGSAAPKQVVEDVVDEEPPAPAPVYVPIEPAEPPREKRQQVARPVPAWYAAAKEKAAKDKERRAAASQTDDDSAVLSYRSRFADAPAATIDSPAEEEAQIEERLEELGAQYEEEIKEAEGLEAKEAEKQAEVVEQAEEVLESIDIPDDQLDELSPDSSGLFPRVELEDEHAEKAETSPKQLTSRIPNIGSSDDKVRAERKMAAEERASRAGRPELQSIPVVNDDVDFGEVVVDAVETAAVVEAPVAASTKFQPQRKKPTTRHVTESFKPTRAVDADRPMGDKRQEAPVSSTYEGTPQATGSFEAVEVQEEYQASERFTRTVSRTRSERPGAAPRVGSDPMGVSPASTSSFPSLTGSFPALSGSMPVVDAEDFSTSAPGVVANDAALDRFMASGQTTEIDIPESRFRNAVDKVGGLFSRKNKDDDLLDTQEWDDGDYGWKGGGYFEEEAEMALDAARQRAAQIRESVIAMTESDLLDKEVWFVALGASSAGNQGMKNFLDLHASELRGSLIINLEAVGAGTVSYVATEGTGKPRRADRRLMSLVKKASKELKGKEMKSKNLDWRNTDATPAMSAGMRALTLMGFADNGVAPVDWHCASDTAGIVSEGNLEYVSRLLLKVIENS